MSSAPTYDFTKATPAEVQAAIKWQREHRIDQYYPSVGPLRRELYPQHLAFFRAGRQHRERLFLAANRVGKTEGVGAYEMTLHLTGKYPSWWEGRRFDQPIKAWACGDTAATTRDIVQAKLLGQVTQEAGRSDSIIGLGTGMVPKDAIGSTRPRSGVPNAIELAYIRHVSGRMSALTFKSYEQGREVFQGTEQDVIWGDEAIPEDIYAECLMRTMTTNGLVYVTFTPLQGLTPLIESFLPGGKLPE